MKRLIAVAAMACMIAGAEVSQITPASALESGSSNFINAKSLCGTWEDLPGTGGFHELTSDHGRLKGSGLDRDGHDIKYTISDANSRTAVAVQTINMEEGQSFKIRDKFQKNAVRTLIGVTNRNLIIFGVQGEDNTEIWTPLKPGMFEVVGIEHGSDAMTYYYTIKQISKSSCKAD